jgi:hypothetical protein
VAGDQSSRIGRWAAVLVVAAIVGMWLYIFSGAAREDPPDRLDDPAFAGQAEPRCAEALTGLDDLPAAGESASADARAAVLDDANELLTNMVHDLDAIPVADDDDRELVDLWIDDWRRYLDDRRAYAEELQVDPEAELLVTARGGRQITLTIDRFATVNDMESCVTPLDA